MPDFVEHLSTTIWGLKFTSDECDTICEFITLLKPCSLCDSTEYDFFEYAQTMSSEDSYYFYVLITCEECGKISPYVLHRIREYLDKEKNKTLFSSKTSEEFSDKITKLTDI